MKKILLLLLGVFVVFAFAEMTANACYTDCIGGLCGDGDIFYKGNIPLVKLNEGESRTFTYDFSYIGAEDAIQKAYLGIGIWDDERDCNNRTNTLETANVSVNGIQIWSSEVDTKLLPYSINLASILGADKLLSVTIGAACGDFKVTLVGIAGCYKDNPVPEPASMLLLGTGLLGLVCVRRKSRRR